MAFKEDIDSIEDVYGFYIRQYESTPNLPTLQGLRKRLLLRLFNERLDLLDNPIFLKILEHEEHSPLTSDLTNATNRSVLAITRAVQLHNSSSEFRPRKAKQVIQMLNAENRFRCFELTVAEWLVHYYVRLDTSKARSSMKSYIKNNNTLRGLVFKNEIASVEMSEYRRKVELGLEAKISLSSDREYKSQAIRSCVILFLLHLEANDSINAEYYLMRAVSLNHSQCECEFLLEFLNNLILIK